MVKSSNPSLSQREGGKISFKQRALSSVVATTLVVGLMPSLAWATPQQPAEEPAPVEQVQEPAAEVVAAPEVEAVAEAPAPEEAVAEEDALAALEAEDEALEALATGTVVTVGEGTSTTQGRNVPFTNYYKNGTSQMLYTAAEVGAAGSIHGIAFNLKSAGTLTTNVKVYMANTTKTSFASSTDALPASDYTLVYSGTSIGATEAGWVWMNFETPFEYDGTNLAVAVCQQGSSYSSTMYYYCTGIADMTLYRQNDGTASYGELTGTQTYTSAGERPNMQIDIVTCAHENSAFVSTTAPTCEVDGYDTYHCSDCDKDYQKNIVAALGHDYEGATQFACDKDGTANEAGKFFGEACQRTGCTNVKVTPNPLYAGTWDGESADAWINGSGTAEDPYLIETASNLVYLAQQVNASSSQHYAGTYFKLTRDLDMTAGSMPSIGTGTTYYFAGVFDGDGHSVEVAMEGSNNYYGLFGSLYHTSSSTPTTWPELKNLVLKGSVVNKTTTAGYTGGLVGYLKYAKITDCRNEASVSYAGTSTSQEFIAGIVGFLGYYEGIVSGCSNLGTISASTNNSYCAGIAGKKDQYAKGTITNCYNVGSITSEKYYASGIIGYNYYGSSASYATSISNCYNAGTLTGSYTGGIGGYFYASTSSYGTYSSYNKLTNCYWANDVENYYAGTTAPSSTTYAVTDLTAVASNTMNTSDFVAGLGEAYMVGSNHAMLTWEAPAGAPVFATQPEGAVYVKNDTATALTVAATTTSGEAISYQWYKSANADLSEAVAIEGATTASYTPATTELGITYYYCKATVDTDDLRLFPATSEAAMVRVWSGAVAVAPSITAQPVSAAYGQGAAADALSVTATFAGEGETAETCVLTYQWQSAAEAEGEFANIEGATAAQYTPSTQELGTKYFRCVVTNTLEGQSSAFTTSDVASVAVAGRTISTAAELAAFAAEVNAGDTKEGFTTTLMADIDATDVLTSPIGMNASQYFGGTFDGNGHSIKVNLSGTTQYIALFGYTKNATIQNLTVKGSITGAYNGGYVGGHVAGIVAYGFTGTKILNCANEAAVTSNFVGSSSGAYTGGISAYFQGTLIDGCYNAGAVSSETASAGGIMGYGYGCTVSNCYNTGTISGASYYTGGIAGLCSGTSTSLTYYKNCYSNGKILGTSQYQGVVWASSINSNAITTNCYYDSQVNGDMPAVVLGSSGIASATAKTTSEMQAAAALLNGEQDPAPFADDIYAQNDGYPVLVWQQAGIPEGTPAINAQSRSQAVPASETPLILSVTAAGADNLTYQWTMDGTAIEGAIGATYAASIATAGTHVYTCTVANGELSTTSAAIEIIAYAPATAPTVAVTPTEDQTVKAGGAAVVLTASGTSTDEGAVMSYQWQSCATADGEFANVEGATNAEFTIPAAELGETYYRCVVTSTVVVPENTASAITAVVKATVVPLTIETAADWAAFAAKVNGGETLYGQTILLGNDLTLTSDDFAAVGTYSSRQFTGTFDGQGYTITLSDLSTTTAATSALFGYIGEQGTVKNLNVAGSLTNTTQYVGAIAGTNKGRIENCASSATVKGAYTGTVYVGGIAGQNYGTIYQCATTADASITGNSTSTSTGNCYVGGICGYNYGQILSCYNAGAVKADCAATNTWTYAYAGGVVGYDYHAYADTMANKVENCFNAGAVTASKSSDTTNTYARVGGVVGYQDTSNYSDVRTYNVVNCYSVGTLTGGATYGVMYNKSATGVALADIFYTNLFYLDTTATKALESATSGTITNVVAKTAEELKSAEVLAALNSGVAEGEDPIWIAAPAGMNSGYPILSWMFDAPIVFNEVTVGEDTYAASKTAEGAQALRLVTVTADVMQEGYVPALNGAALMKRGEAWLTLVDATTAATLTTASFEAIEGTATEIVAGDIDVNGSGSVNIVDAQVAYDMAKGSYTFGSEGVLTLKSWLVADANGDKALDSLDAFAIQYKLHYAS